MLYNWSASDHLQVDHLLGKGGARLQLGGWETGGWTRVTSADRTLGPHEGSGLRSERLGQKLWPKTDGPWSYSLSDTFLLYDSL